MEISFLPDWTASWTIQEAQDQLEGFEFVGPGWYVDGDCVTLVVPEGDFSYTDRWRRSAWPSEQKFTFYVYGDRNPKSVFGSLALAPIRVLKLKNGARVT